MSPFRYPDSSDEVNDSLPSQVSKTLLISDAVPTDRPYTGTTALKPSALSSDHAPSSHTLLIESAVPTDPPPVNVYSLLDQAVPVQPSQVSKTLLIPEALPNEAPYIYTTLLKD